MKILPFVVEDSRIRGKIHRSRGQMLMRLYRHVNAWAVLAGEPSGWTLNTLSGPKNGKERAATNAHSKVL
jgi:hypothetical protein